jgi:hypothetical protein
MRMTTAAWCVAIAVSAAAHGQSHEPVLGAYAALPLSETSHASFLTPELAQAASPPIDAAMDVELVSHTVDCTEPVLPPLGSESYWFGAIELTMLDPRVATASIGKLESESFTAPRGVIGWESPGHLGLRARVWGAVSETDFIGPNMEVKPSRFDFDVYRRFLFNDASLIVGSGVTGARMEYEFEQMGRLYDRGAGIQFFAEGRHTYRRSDVSESSIFARGRWAGLSGVWVDEVLASNDEGNSSMEILEAALGLEWRRRFKHGDLIIQSSFESQTWESTLTGDVAFFGTVFSVGFAR